MKERGGDGGWKLDDDNDNDKQQRNFRWTFSLLLFFFFLIHRWKRKSSNGRYAFTLTNLKPGLYNLLLLLLLRSNETVLCVCAYIYIYIRWKEIHVEWVCQERGWNEPLAGRLYNKPRARTVFLGSVDVRGYSLLLVFLLLSYSLSLCFTFRENCDDVIRFYVASG